MGEARLELSRTGAPAGDVIRRTRLLVFLSVGAAALIGWIYLGLVVADMLPYMDMAALGPGMGVFNSFNLFAGLPEEARAAIAALCLPTGSEGFGMPAVSGWGAVDLALVFLMWVMMTLAMMLPSASPMIATYAELAEDRGTSVNRTFNVLAVCAGYLTMWTAYSTVATLAQWGLTEARALSPMMAPATTILAGTTLLAAGLYQFTGAKQACLVRCQKPRAYFAVNWSDRPAGAYRLGLDQGLFCLGCCWALMSVMFAVGVMNVLWIALLGFVMAVEKIVVSRWLSPAIGVLLIAWGGLMILSSPAGQAWFAG
ncbi:DUF2182 domain-containing protein [Stappia sp. F7233]|uniref:DUF2182 domain-containing protein n=1 Tax=Stappia albiluteola TaxID=2758565 RepID=A0A839ACB1_9HYPH|nr:DUF2182 domain-containing protein [Stappia albiluteola]MBA5776786.1 DUF2182 domain-containing protein [Stappia albiluteola]